jgi:hypothetical protein
MASGGTVLGRTAAAAALRRLSQKGTLTYTGLEAPLRRAVLLHWGSMTQARQALGLRQLPAPRQMWSRKRVLDEIAKLHRSGQHMSTSAVIEAGRSDLLIAANKYVGSWVRARALAGVSFKARRVASMPVWDAATVIAEIKERHRRNLPLALTKTPKSLTCAANRIFGSWRSAIDAAGIDYDSVLLLRRYGDEELLAWLRQLARAKPHMSLYDLDKYGQHTVACRRRWGSLEAAAQAAGLTAWPARIRHRAMSRAQVIRTLRQWHAAKRSLRFSVVRRAPGGNYLINSAFHHFVTWDKALAAAGLFLERRTPGT